MRVPETLLKTRQAQEAAHLPQQQGRTEPSLAADAGLFAGRSVVALPDGRLECGLGLCPEGPEYLDRGADDQIVLKGADQGGDRSGCMETSKGLGRHRELVAVEGAQEILDGHFTVKGGELPSRLVPHDGFGKGEHRIQTCRVLPEHHLSKALDRFGPSDLAQEAGRQPPGVWHTLGHPL
jgi:hypothetical protein